MLVCDRFVGDNNETLQWVQHDVYWNVLNFLYSYPKGIYLQAVAFTGVETELSMKI